MIKQKENNDKKKSKKKPILLTVLALFLFIAGFSSIYFFNMLNKLKTAAISQTHEDLGISTDTQSQLDSTDNSEDIVNIALFGIDQRNVEDNGRSDAIMILTIDKTTKKIKLSSVMRDSYVAIDGHGKEKITHAYAYGGAQLAVKTLNQNFNLSIKDYITVNFYGLADIIDAMGGVTLDVQKSEIKYINECIKEVAGIENIKPTYIKNAGSQNLSGIQAVAYARIRHVGNGDYERTERQRKVLSALISKLQTMNVTQYPALANQLTSFVLTNMSSVDMLKLATDVVSSGTSTIEQQRFPVDGYCQGTTINGASVIKFDETATKNQIFKYIYEDIAPQAK